MRKPRNEKTLENQEFPGFLKWQNAPQGVEETANSHGKTTISQLGGVAGGVIFSDLMELADLWPKLSIETRSAFLAIARSATKH